jgi:SpoVK/Ycf46/Vps4 family AAA+-type ATPase
MAPCVLMVDELEKGLSGSQSSGSTDGGTSSRILGSFLSWLQEKTAPVFVVATANEVAALPPEMLRKGRFDNLFFVDLPGQTERAAIWAIQVRKYGRTPEAYDLKALATASDRMTGSEIEQAFVEALYAGFADAKEPDDATVHAVLRNAVPLAGTMAEKVEALR